MSKQIVITDSNGKETVVEGNFENAVNVKLEDKPEMYWFTIDRNYEGRFRTNSDNLYASFQKEGAAKTKREAVANFIKWTVTHGINDFGVSYCVPFLEIAVKELKNYG